jgi:hypothetical protein
MAYLLIPRGKADMDNGGDIGIVSG